MTSDKELREQKIITLSKGCAEALSNKKAEDIKIMDLRKVNSYLDFFILATGNSLVHCAGLVKEVQKFFHENSFSGRGKPGADSGWQILDYDELIIHIFTKELREYYQLERLWGDAEFIDF